MAKKLSFFFFNNKNSLHLKQAENIRESSKNA